MKHCNLLKTIILMVIFASSMNSNAANHFQTNEIEQTLKVVYEKYKNFNEGKNADYIPELQKVNSKLFGIAVASVDGKIVSIGDVNVPFAMESISKVFVYALALQDHGEENIEKKVGLNATGHGFNSVLAIEEDSPDHLQNSLVNAGAIQMTSLIKGKDSAEKWQRVLTLFKDLSGGNPYLGKAVYQSEMLNNKRNRAIAELLDSYNLMYSDPMDAVDRYTKACSIMMTTRELAIMGATLANRGVNPITHQKIILPQYVKDVLSAMTTNGLYENSGAWWMHVGIPAKSGVGGGIVAVVPGKMAIVVFSPPLDKAGNSVRAQKVIETLSQQWHLHLLSI